MKSNKVVLLLAATVFCLSLAIGYFAAAYAGKGLGDNIFALSYNNESASADDIDLLTRENRCFTFTARSEADAASETMKAKATVVGTNSGFVSLAGLNIISGAFFNGVHEEKRSAAAVLNSAAAWYFFGNDRCAGRGISINGRQYQVIGVAENRFGREDEKLIYIPFEVMRKKEFKYNISDILISAGSIGEIEPLGFLSPNVQVTGLEQYKNIITQRTGIVVFGVGICVILLVFRKCLDSLKASARDIKAFLEEEYASDLPKLLKRKYFMGNLCLAAGYILLILLIINLIKFKLYLPYYFFSLNGLNYSVLADLLDFFIQPHITVSFLRHLNGLNMVSNLMFFVSVLSGTVTLQYITKKQEPRWSNVLPEYTYRG